MVKSCLLSLSPSLYPPPHIHFTFLIRHAFTIQVHLLAAILNKHHESLPHTGKFTPQGLHSFELSPEFTHCIQEIRWKSSSTSNTQEVRGL